MNYKAVVFSLIIVLLLSSFGVYAVGAATGNGGQSANGKIAYSSIVDGNWEIYTMNPDGSSPVRLTNNNAGDEYPTWSPDGTKIAFRSDRDGNMEIYMMNANGAGQTRLTDNIADDYDPSWSPDGTKIAFSSDRDGNFDIYMMNADGTNQTRITHNSGDDWDPRWSPDGTKIAFTGETGGNSDVYVINADGSSQLRLTTNAAEDESPDWFPDGTKIAFDSNRDGNFEIYTMNADGSSQTRITNSNSVDARPRWSPDGTKIAFSSDRVGSWQIYIMNPDGSSQWRLTRNSVNNFYPSWEVLSFTSFQQVPRENGKIAFTSDRAGNFEIYTMNPDGSDQTRLTTNTATERYPDWSPDSSKIVFVSNRDGNYEVYSMNSDGSGQTRLTTTAADEWYTGWSPDGTKILFVSERDGNAEVYTMNSDGSSQTRLTTTSADEWYAKWSPDGTKIVFISMRDGNGEVYVMNRDGSGQTRLTTTNADEWYTGWSPDGTKILFTSMRDGNYEVYVMNADGSGQTRLTNNVAEERWPAWSPDGSKIAFVTNRDGNWEIYLMNPDGSSPVNIISNAATEYYPSWQALYITTFQQTGIGTDFSGNILNVDGASFTDDQLPTSFTWETGTMHSFSWSSPLTVSSDKRYVWSSASGLSTAQSGTFPAPFGGSSMTGNYTTQFYVAFLNSTGGSSDQQSGWRANASMINASSIALPGYVCTGWELSGGLQPIGGNDLALQFRVIGPGAASPVFQVMDLVPPNITVLSPVNGSTTTNSMATISASYADNIAIDLTSIMLKVNGVNVTPNATVTGTNFTWSTTFVPGTYSIELTLKDTYGNPQTAAWSFTVQEPPKSGCFIATATYGSEAAPQVQALRDFRDGIAMKTFAGSSFMTVFLTWYYSWSPPVASSIAPNDNARAVMLVALQPLLNILDVATVAFSALSFNSEFAIVATGFVVATLIGLVYFLPLTTLALIGAKSYRRNLVLPSAFTMLRFAAVPWMLTVALIATAEIILSPTLMMAATAAFVICTILLTVSTISIWLAHLCRRG